MLPVSVPAQTLAHRGWAGSGLSNQPWWHDAVLYQIGLAQFAGANEELSGTGSNGDADRSAEIAQRLDYLKALGADALVITPFDLHPGATTATSAEALLEQTHEDNFDSLMNQASTRHMRILVDLPLDTQTAATTLATARYWLAHGVAGLQLTFSGTAPDVGGTSAADVVRLVRDLRAVCADYAGERVLLWDGKISFQALLDRAQGETEQQPQAISHHRRGRRRSAKRAAPTRGADAPSLTRDRGPQLVVDDALRRLSSLDAADLRSALLAVDFGGASARALPVLEMNAHELPGGAGLDGSSPEVSTVVRNGTARLLAALLFTTPGVPLLRFGQELGSPAPVTSAAVPPQAAETIAGEGARPDSPLNFYRLLSSLRHSNATLRDGSLRLLAISQPDVIGWLRVGHGNGQSARPVAVVLNLSGQAQVVALDGVLRAAGLQVPNDSLMRTLAVSRPLAPDGIIRSASTSGIPLEPYGVFIGELRGQAVTPAASRTHSHRHHR